MAIKRPKTLKEEDTGTDSEVELMEQLVAKSMEINPALRGERNTQEVMADLKRQIAKKGKGPGPAASGGDGDSDDTSAAEKRAKSIAFFLEQKKQEVTNKMTEFKQREDNLRNEKKGAQATFAREIIDFLSLLGAGPDAPEIKNAIFGSRPLWADLGTSETEMLTKLRGGKK